MMGPHFDRASVMRSCPHCRASILARAASCPVCRHHLRFISEHERALLPPSTPFRMEGTFRPPCDDSALEYTIVLSICNEHGEELERQLVSAGALFAGERRTVSVTIEAFEVHEYKRTPHH